MGVLGVVLGILAVLAALLATFLFGTVGGIIAGVLGAAAIVLGILKRKKEGKGGVASIAIGVLSILLAFSLCNTWSGVFTKMRNKALAYKPDSLWAQVSEDTTGGLMGMISKLPKDEATLNAFIEEMNELGKLEDSK